MEDDFGTCLECGKPLIGAEDFPDVCNECDSLFDENEDDL